MWLKIAKSCKPKPGLREPWTAHGVRCVLSLQYSTEAWHLDVIKCQPRDLAAATCGHPDVRSVAKMFVKPSQRLQSSCPLQTRVRAARPGAFFDGVRSSARTVALEAPEASKSRFRARIPSITLLRKSERLGVQRPWQCLAPDFVEHGPQRMARCRKIISLLSLAPQSARRSTCTRTCARTCTRMS